jgi:spore coat protein U-like protein
LVGGTLAFGNYDPIAAGPTDGSLQIAVRCTRGVAATIGLSLGSNATGSTRRMTNGADFLSYELYKDPPRTIVWGNSGADLLPYAAVSNGWVNFTVQGRVSALQDVPVGSFTDTVTITVTF